MSLEPELRALGAAIAWPETPPPRPLPLAAPRRRRQARGALALAAVALAAAVAAAFAVPQSRGAILRLLHLGGATIEVVATLPAAEERPLAAGLGPVVDAASAREALGGGPLLLPPLEPPPPLHAARGVVSAVFRYGGGSVLLSEVAGPGGALLKKLASGGTRIRWLRLDGEPAVWLTGSPHVFLFPGAAPRLAGDVLLFQRGRLTLRLEGPGLTLRRASQLARSLR